MNRLSKWLSGAFLALLALTITHHASGVGIVTQSGPRCFNCTTGGGGGSLTDGADYSFTSGGSISAPPQTEWLGGKNGVIDSGTTDAVFSRASWNRLGASNNVNWRYKVDRLRNRSHAFRYSGAEQGESGGNARGTYQYDFGPSGCTEMYLSYTYYWQINTSFNAVQWKMFRVQQVTDHDGTTDNGFGAPEVVDGNPPSAYWSNSTARDNMPFSQFTSDVAGAHWIDPNTQTAFTQAGWNTSDHGGTVAAKQNAWTRLQFFWKENSNTSTADGTGRVILTNADGTNYADFSVPSRLYRGPNDYSRATRPFRYLILQNYFGNGSTTPSGNDWGDTILWLDDVYLGCSTSGTSAQHHVEIDDGVSEPNIQKIKSASGTSRTIELNLGHLDCVTNHCRLKEYDSSNTVITNTLISAARPAANDDWFDAPAYARAA